MLKESLHQRGAAVNDDGAALPLAQAADFLHEVTAEDRRVAPLGRAQGRRDDVLGHAVELVGEFSRPRRPGGGESLIGPAPQQQRLRLEGLVYLELIAL